MKEIDIEGFDYAMTVVTLPDRRSGTAVRTEWLVSSELEQLLFNNPNSTGALRKLVARAKEATGTTAAAMPLRSSNAGGLVTNAEWKVISSMMSSGARVISLLPVDLAVSAMIMFGKEPVTEAILAALNEFPSDWMSDEEEEEEGEEEEEEEGDDAGEDGTEDGGAGDGGAGEGGAGSAKDDDGEGEEAGEGADDDEKSNESGEGGGAEEDDEEMEDDEPAEKVAKS